MFVYNVFRVKIKQLQAQIKYIVVVKINKFIIFKLLKYKALINGPINLVTFVDIESIVIDLL